MEGGAAEEASGDEAGWLEQRRREAGRRPRHKHDVVEEERAEGRAGLRRAGSGGLGRWRRSRAMDGTGTGWPVGMGARAARRNRREEASARDDDGGPGQQPK